MKKRGFTLAEVLITLGIVGVVAALTAPSLVMSSRNEANAARLSVVVSNLENAFNNAIIQEGADNLYGTSLWANGAIGGNVGNIPAFVGNLGRYMVLNGFKNSDTEFIGANVYHQMTNNGGTDNTTSISVLPGRGQCFAIETKNGAVIYIRTYANPGNAALEQARTNAIAAGSSYYTNAADVYIDVNGKSAPNTFGRDLFGFQVGENGVLYPQGGRDVSRMDTEGGAVTNVWDNAGQLYSCTDADKGNDAKGLGCTARVIAEGYKINY